MFSYIMCNPSVCMNETLYIWKLKFHKVVRQQKSGVVKDFILPYSTVYLRIQKWKSIEIRSTFAKVILKIKVALFYGVSINSHVIVGTVVAYNYIADMKGGCCTCH